MKIEKETPHVMMYKLKCDNEEEDKDRCAWANFTLDFDMRRLSIHSDLGDFDYVWGPSDNQPLMQLLSEVTEEYLLSKISSRSIFDIVETKNELIKDVKAGWWDYGVEEADAIINAINEIPDITTEESWLNAVKDIIKNIEFVDIPVEKRYPHNARLIAKFFIKYLQPEIKKDIGNNL